MSNLIADFFQERLSSGLYAEMADDIQRFGNPFLGDTTFNRDFVRIAPRWPPHYSYRAKTGDSDKEYHTLLFGEIASPVLGTIHCAAGNHSFDAGENMIAYLTDDSKPREVFTLQCPTLAPPIIDTLFKNQLATLGEIRAFDEEEEIKADKKPYIKDFVRSSKPDGENPIADIFNVHMPVKFEKPGGASASTALKRVQKKSIDGAEIEDAGATTTPPSGTIPTAGTDFQVPSGEDIHVGAHYDPRVLYDFRGAGFKLVQNKLIQRDIRDVKGDLIPPWKAYEELRTGTVVLIEATIHCFRFNINGRRERKVYQLHANRLTVLAKSDSEVEIRIPPQISGHLQPTTPTPSPPAASSGNDAASAFADFRKRKLVEITAAADKKMKMGGNDSKIDKKTEAEAVAASNKVRRAPRKAIATTDDHMNCE